MEASVFPSFLCKGTNLFRNSQIISQEIFKNNIHTYINVLYALTITLLDHVCYLHKLKHTYIKRVLFAMNLCFQSANLHKYKLFRFTYPLRNFLFPR